MTGCVLIDGHKFAKGVETVDTDLPLNITLRDGVTLSVQADIGSVLLANSGSSQSSSDVWLQAINPGWR